MARDHVVTGLPGVRELATRAIGGERVLSPSCDVTNAAQVELLFADVEKKSLTFDALISNTAGLGSLGSVATKTVSEWRQAVGAGFGTSSS
jgi:NAD(P)-dependent dehydrogenase (short-subunit alcohol dehydrogenase family)